ncbi:hypothetical protein CC78DRAFT_488842 [Lojkania enalia]|uniref:Uncharacterized protein n=1 Tax=Lojkania enalia TaxID=147567 RepID=A0A9P4KJ83_9PLEO|nr:hypothetical protein CC78DRAFT_488842 [Didymosphaeria enalia]
MRFIARLHVLAAAAIVTIFFISWWRPSLNIQGRILKAWRRSSRRLVVFGDGWSDTGDYCVSPPPKSTVQHKDPDRGGLWTEALCEKLACDGIDNYARSIPSNLEVPTIGSVVDSDILTNATFSKRNRTLTVFDFKAQVQQFIDFEKQKLLIPRLPTKREWTIFTVFFGIIDLLEYSALERIDAMRAIDQSVEELLHHLDVLAEHVGEPIRVIIPKLPDVTFLPRFQMKKNDSSSSFAQSQHQSVFLWKYWNTALSQAAAKWGHGDLYMPDFNAIIMYQVRASQLYSQLLSDVSIVGNQISLFDEVKQPCLPLNPDGNELQAADVDKCSEPARYLFWDDMHLSGPAHELIGREAARLVSLNKTINDPQGRSSQGSTPGQTDGKNSAGFDLKFPPGY